MEEPERTQTKPPETKKIIVSVPFDHLMIPPNKKAIEIISAITGEITGRTAHPVGVGLQAIDPATIELEGTKDHLTLLKKYNFDARFA